jgi:hypothetical protein
MLAGLILLTLTVYWQAHRFEFINFDDADYVYDNRWVHAGFTAATVREAFTTYRMGNWNPLLWFSFYTDEILFHLKPGPMHVENVLLHLITGLLLWRLLFVSTGSLNRSFVVAALFLVHPMHVESVAWVTERKDVLSTPLLIAAMLAYVRYCKNPSGRWIAYLAMLVLFALSLLVKTMGVTLPAVLLLMDYWPLGRWPKQSWLKLVIEKIPVLAISIGASVMGAIAQYVIGAAATVENLPMSNRIENAILCYVIYIAKLLVPINLGVFYPHALTQPMPAVVISAILLTIATYFFFRIRKRFPYVITGWFFFLGTLVPVIGLVQVGGQSMADRYSYLPSIGIFIVLVWGCGDALPGKLRTPAAFTIVGIFTIMGHVQAAYWRNTETLFTHTSNVTDDSALVHVELAQVAIEKKDIHRAVDQCNLALAHGPSALAYFTLGECWLNEDPRKARGFFIKAVEMQPRAVLYHVSYAESLRRISELPETRKDPGEVKRDMELAKQQAQAAIKLDPGDPNALDELSKVNAEPAQ